jgi:hypothetical protein
MALVLVIPAATAYGADDQATQPVDVTVLPAGLLTVDVDGSSFGVMVPGQTTTRGFRMNVTNTSNPAAGWVVTVTGGVFESGYWDCDEFGCTWVPDSSPETIPASALSITGGDLNWWEDPSVIVPGSGTFGGAPITIDTATALAWGGFDIKEPSPELTLAVPAATVPGLQYRTVLTYTITAAQ